MSYQERRAIADLISTLLITVIYFSYVMDRYPVEADPYAVEIFHYWGSIILILIPVTIVAKIISIILFTIVNTILTREEPPEIEDERDKVIELKSQTNSNYVFIFGFILAMVALVLELPPATMFVILILSGVLSEVIGNISQFLYYRRGV